MASAVEVEDDAKNSRLQDVKGYIEACKDETTQKINDEQETRKRQLIELINNWSKENKSAIDKALNVVQERIEASLGFGGEESATPVKAPKSKAHPKELKTYAKRKAKGKAKVVDEEEKVVEAADTPARRYPERDRNKEEAVEIPPIGIDPKKAGEKRKRSDN